MPNIKKMIEKETCRFKKYAPIHQDSTQVIEQCLPPASHDFYFLPLYFFKYLQISQKFIYF